jgi:uncharacterized protein with LGFP repeats
MTRLRNLVGTTSTRAATVLVAAMAVAFLAPSIPSASADPASDADSAISQAWDAGGGATGPLGAKDGAVYPVGGGFGQNFAGGKIFFTPDTGAHIMTGAILDKYMALGGPGDGDLGFPNIDEGAGRAPNSRNTTFSAADKPVIFWTPDTGARVVRGAINAAWDKVGGSAGVLGVPSDDEVYKGDVVSQTFTGGQLSWNRKTGEFTSTPPELAQQLVGLTVPGDVASAIAAARRSAGGAMGPLGAEEGAEYKIGTDGVGQNFAGGKIFYSPATGANVVTGQILAKYESVGGPEGDLGLPATSEADGGLKPSSSVVAFAASDKPVIFWTPDFGAVIVRGAMNAAWTKLGGATGELGAPTADQSQSGDVITQKFSGGAISWDKKSNEFTTEPAGLASQLAGLDVPALESPQQTPAAQDGPKASGGKWYQWHQWWLLAIVPVLLLLVAIVAGVIFNRRRRDHDDREPLNEFDDEYDDDHDDDFDDFDDLHPMAHQGYESGPMPIVDPGREDARYAPASMWAMPVDRGPAAKAAEPAAEAAKDSEPETPSSTDAETTFAEDEDAIDTAPTRIVADPDQDAETTRLAAETVAVGPPADVVDVDDDDDEPDYDAPSSGPVSGRHAAIQLEETTATRTAFRIASNDGYSAPEGYPIKADTKSGLYWTPDSSRYPQARAEIWFSSEEFALTNGFVKG